ncbi:MAG: hypothetical protein ACRD22_08800 [Terriglobia bacterium]
MKFTVSVACSSCGFKFDTPGYGEQEFPPAKCPRCLEQIHIIDPLTISIVAERLLLRGQRELDEGDFTLSIICSAMAVECALTHLFLKWKGLDHFGLTGQSSTELQRQAWERDYRKETSGGGFEKSANFVSEFLTGKKYDEIATDLLRRSNEEELAEIGFSHDERHVNVIHRELFMKRNRIVHWGDVSYDTNDASNGLTAARAAISVLRLMDREKYSEMERQWRLSIGNSASSEQVAE